MKIHVSTGKISVWVDAETPEEAIFKAVRYAWIENPSCLLGKIVATRTTKKSTGEDRIWSTENVLKKFGINLTQAKG